MKYSYATREDTFWIFILVIIVIFVVLMFCFNEVMSFMQERDYIKMEIKRSNDKEYYYWKRKLKKLYLSHIPIIGRFFR